IATVCTLELWATVRTLLQFSQCKVHALASVVISYLITSITAFCSLLLCIATACTIELWPPFEHFPPWLTRILLLGLAAFWPLQLSIASVCSLELWATVCTLLSYDSYATVSILDCGPSLERCFSFDRVYQLNSPPYHFQKNACKYRIQTTSSS
uniref:MARVEL domain-containing protein n=1 Tax=Haemonchus contortus TaxID=6289 RepID=A0A7I4YN07_HAECO